MKIHRWKAQWVGYSILVVIPQDGNEAIPRLVTRKQSLWAEGQTYSNAGVSVEVDRTNFTIITHHLTRTPTIGMAETTRIIPIHTITMDRHQSRFLNFNIHPIHSCKKMASLNKSISNTNKNVSTVKRNSHYERSELIRLRICCPISD